jgi:diguanylate cyclase (GGDEF)-like protein
VAETAARLLEGALDMDATLRAVADAARRALGADRATCYVHSEDGRHMARVFSTEEDPRRLARLTAVEGRRREDVPIWHLMHGEPVVIPDVAASRTLPPVLRAALPPGAILGVWLEHSSVGATDRDAAVLGSLFVSWREPRDITRHDELLARSLAGMASMAVANARLHAATLESLAQAERRAARDPLTDLANHRAFHDRLGDEVARAERHGRALSLVLFDLDRFKAVNDALGHQVGDEVLVAAAQVLEREARDGDLVARVGGEEFAWLMPEADGLDAWQAADRARAAIEQAPMPGVGGITVSAGVCELSRAADAADLYRLADGALYWAKHHGRNVVFHYSPDVVRALSAEDQAVRLRRQQALQSIRMLARAVDAKDSFTSRHSERVAALAARLAERLGWDTEDTDRLREAGLVHDVGKLAISDAILLKAGPLTDDEYRDLKAHAALGSEIVSEVFDPGQVAWVRGHHERWDGRGYPDGLGEGELSDGAAILAMADAWDAMISARPYRDAGSADAAFAECLRERGAQFAPWAVDALAALRADRALDPAPPPGAEAPSPLT